MKTLSDFIESERKRFENKQNNMFAFCFGQIVRYLDFIQVIFERYKIASKNYLENTRDFQKTFEHGTHTFTKQQTELYEDGVKLTVILHLEIESYYQFAKILLDKIAHAIEFYFGSQRSMSLDSHDDLTKCFSEYCKQKSLVVKQELLDMLPRLKKDISDYRDYKISHEKSPRIIRGTVYQGQRTRMSLTKIFPSKKDEKELLDDIDTKFLEELEDDIYQYISMMVKFIKENSKKTRLNLEKKH